VGEITYRGQAGTESLVELRVIPLDGAPRRPGARLVVLLDVTEERRQEQRVITLTEELTDKERSRSLLLDRVIMTAEMERTRMASQVNEGVMQRLSALCLRLDSIIGLPESRGYDLSDRLRFLSDVRIELAEMVADLRSLMATLRPPVLDERGVGPALAALARRLGDESGIQITTHVDPVGKLDDAVESLVYRAAQECVTNAVLHKGSRAIDIRLTTEDADLLLSVSDDGAAFDPADVTPQNLTAKGHVGLASIIERVELAAGTVVVESADSRGTRFTIRLPRRSARREDREEDMMAAHTTGVRIDDQGAGGVMS
jgi:signal transduction histidine kinase